MAIDGHSKDSMSGISSEHSAGSARSRNNNNKILSRDTILSMVSNICTPPTVAKTTI